MNPNWTLIIKQFKHGLVGYESNLTRLLGSFLSFYIHIEDARWDWKADTQIFDVKKLENIKKLYEVGGWISQGTKTDEDGR